MGFKHPSTIILGLHTHGGLSHYWPWLLAIAGLWRCCETSSLPGMVEILDIKSRICACNHVRVQLNVSFCAPRIHSYRLMRILGKQISRSPYQSIIKVSSVSATFLATFLQPSCIVATFLGTIQLFLCRRDKLQVQRFSI